MCVCFKTTKLSQLLARVQQFVQELQMMFVGMQEKFVCSFSNGLVGTISLQVAYGEETVPARIETERNKIRFSNIF